LTYTHWREPKDYMVVFLWCEGYCKMVSPLSALFSDTRKFFPSSRVVMVALQSRAIRRHFQSVEGILFREK